MSNHDNDADEEQKNGNSFQNGNGNRRRAKSHSSSQQPNSKRRWAQGQPYYNRDRFCEQCCTLNPGSEYEDINCGHDAEPGIATLQKSDMICIFAPWWIWRPTARIIGDIKKTNRIAMMYMNLFQWLLEFARALYTADCFQQDKAKKYYPVVVWESVPNADGYEEDNPHHVTLSGIRMRFSCRRLESPVISNNPGMMITKRIWGRMQDHNTDSSRDTHEFSDREWLEICGDLGALGTHPKSHLEAHDVIDANGGCNPLRVFSMDRSVEASKKYKPHTRCANLGDYMQLQRGRWVFPFPHFAFKFDLGLYKSPEAFQQLFLPHLKPLPTMKEIEADIEQYCAMGNPMSPLLEHHFRYRPSVEPEGPSVFTIRRLKEKQRNRIAHIPEKAAVEFPLPSDRTEEENDHCYWLTKELLKLVYVDGLKQFASKIWMEDTLSLAPCVKRNISYWNTHLTKYKSPCLPRPHTFKNLSRIGDLLQNMSLSLHTLDFVESAHQDILRMFISSLQVYFKTKMHCNELIMGKAMNGKSFALNVLITILIVGTWVNLIYRTAKSDTGLNEIPKELKERKLDDEELIAFMPHEQRICINEEVPLASLGILPHKQKGVITEEESLEKNKKTSDKITYSACGKDKDGERIREERTIFVSAVYFEATNEFDKNLTSDAMASRAYLNDQPARNFGKIIHAMLAKRTPQGDILREWNIERFRFMQCRVCRLAQQIRANALPRIDCTASDIFITQVLQRGKTQRLRNLDQTRHFQRASYLAETICAIEAIDLFYDSHITPLKDLPWTIECDIGIRKYLRTNTEHACIALGFLQNQWEDPLIPLMEQVLEEVFTKEYDRWRRLDAKNKVKRGIEAEAKETHKKLLISDNSTPIVLDAQDDIPIGARWPQRPYDYDRLELPQERKGVHFRGIRTWPGMLAKVVQLVKNTPTHTQKPNPTSIPRLIDELLKMKVKVKVQLPNGTMRTQRVPALTIAMKPLNESQTVYEFSMPKLAPGARGGNRLLATVTNVLNRKYQRPRTVVYGAMQPGKPFMFETIEVDPPPNARPMRILQSAWFPDSVKQMAMRMSSCIGTNRYDKIPTILQSQVFARKVRCIELNMDLDEWAIEDFNVRSNLTDTEIKTKPSIWPRHLQEELAKDNYGGDGEAQVYPDFFEDVIDQIDDNASEESVMKASEMLKKLKLVCRGGGTDEDKTLVANPGYASIASASQHDEPPPLQPELEEEEKEEPEIKSDEHPLTFMWQNNYQNNDGVIGDKFWSLPTRPDTDDEKEEKYDDEDEEEEDEDVDVDEYEEDAQSDEMIPPSEMSKQYGERIRPRASVSDMSEDEGRHFSQRMRVS
jgi:hypothetical protein